jgi:hypothetical protein
VTKSLLSRGKLLKIELKSKKSGSALVRGDRHKTSRLEGCFLTFLTDWLMTRAPRRWSWTILKVGYYNFLSNITGSGVSLPIFIYFTLSIDWISFVKSISFKTTAAFSISLEKIRSFSIEGTDSLPFS